MKKGTLLIESEITNTLLSAGLPANLQGFHFLKYAILEVIKSPSLLQQLTKKLYPSIAQKYNVSPAIVERSMRHAIEAGCKNGGVYNINYILNAQYFGENDRPCNGCFIALLAEIVKKNIYKLIASMDEKDSLDKEKLINEIQEIIGRYSDDDIA